MPPLILNTNFIKKDFIFALPWELKLCYQFTFVQFYLLHYVDLVIA